MVFHVAGTVEINGVGVSRNMVVVSDDPAGGTVLARGVSDVNGAFDIGYKDWSGPVITFALDNYGNAWTADEDLIVGDIIHPTTPNGFVYEVTTAGITGTAEPTWPTSGAVNDGSVTFVPVEFYRPIASGSLVGAEWSPYNLYENGERGVWYEMKPDNLYQDEAGTVPVVAAGDPVFRGNDLSPNGIPFYAPTSSARPVWQASEALLFDKVDDHISIDFGATTFAGTVWLKTTAGIIRYEIESTGVWNFPDYAKELHSNNIGPMIIIEGSVTEPKVVLYTGGDITLSGITSLRRWFYLRPDITHIYCGDWDTSAVTDINGCFSRCSITELDVGGWDVSKVTDASRFLFDCMSLTAADVSTWNTSNFSDISLFVYRCTSLTYLPVGNWDISSVTTLWRFAFSCSSLTTLDVSNWNTINVVSFEEFVYGNFSLTTLDVSLWNTANADTFKSFALNCSELSTLDVSLWDISKVTNFSNFVYGCSSLTTLDVSLWDTASVTNFSNFVYGCSSLTTLDVSLWDTASVTSFERFIQGCSSLTALDVSNWNTINVTSFFVFAFSCSSLTTLDVSNWNTTNVITFSNFAHDCSSLTTVTVNGGAGNPFADSLCTNYGSAFTNTNLTQQSIDDILVAIEQAGTSTGTFDQSGGSAPSAVGNAAIDALRARGWTITVTGAY